VTGEAAAQADQERRAARVRDRQEEQQRREVYESVRRNLESLHDEAAVVLDAVMAALGYYRHDRGKWRKRRAKATGRES